MQMCLLMRTIFTSCEELPSNEHLNVRPVFTREKHTPPVQNHHTCNPYQPPCMYPRQESTHGTVPFCHSVAPHQWKSDREKKALKKSLVCARFSDSSMSIPNVLKALCLTLSTGHAALHTAADMDSASASLLGARAAPDHHVHRGRRHLEWISYQVG